MDAEQVEEWFDKLDGIFNPPQDVPVDNPMIADMVRTGAAVDVADARDMLETTNKIFTTTDPQRAAQMQADLDARHLKRVNEARRKRAEEAT